MKKSTFLLSLVSLALTVTAASAATPDYTDNLYVMPAYNVSSPRYTPVEKAINASLADFAQQARVSPPVATALPALGTVANQAQPDQGRSVAKTPAPHSARRS